MQIQLHDHSENHSYIDKYGIEDKGVELPVIMSDVMINRRRNLQESQFLNVSTLERLGIGKLSRNWQSANF